jgi:hypothetical protein
LYLPFHKSLVFNKTKRLEEKAMPFAYLERSREFFAAVGNGVSKVTGPSAKLLKEVLETLEKGEASFEGLKTKEKSESVSHQIFNALQYYPLRTYLEDNPEPSADASNWPCEDPKDDQPNDCEKRVLGHGIRVYLYKVTRRIKCDLTNRLDWMQYRLQGRRAYCILNLRIFRV